MKESILLMAVSKAVTTPRKAASCSHSGLDRRSEEIFTAALDMAERSAAAGGKRGGEGHSMGGAGGGWDVGVLGVFLQP